MQATVLYIDTIIARSVQKNDVGEPVSTKEADLDMNQEPSSNAIIELLGARLVTNELLEYGLHETSHNVQHDATRDELPENQAVSRYQQTDSGPTVNVEPDQRSESGPGDLAGAEGAQESS